jgi:two-component system OmpR family sensor kinase
VDSSRARGQGGGSGLGLSIVAAVVSAHAGRVGVAPTPGGGATFRVELPAAEVAAEEPEEVPTVPVRTRGRAAAEGQASGRM